MGEGTIRVINFKYALGMRRYNCKEGRVHFFGRDARDLRKVLALLRKGGYAAKEGGVLF